MEKAVPAYRIGAVLDEEKGFSLTADGINGGFLPGREALHWPSLERVRLKKTLPLGGDSYSLQIKGLKRSQVREGDLLIPADWDAGRCKKALFYCPGGNEYGKDRSLGTTTLTGDPLVKRNIKAQLTFSGYLVRAEFSDPVLGIKGAEYRFLRIGEPLILIERGQLRRGDGDFVGRALSSWKDNREGLFREYLALELGWHGFAQLPREYETLTLPRCEKGEGLLIRTQKFQATAVRIRKRAAAMGGVSFSALTDPLEQRTAELLLARKELVRRGDWLLLAGRESDAGLSPMAKRQLTLLREGTGIANPAESREGGARENWEAMGRMGLVRYAEGLVMTRERYEGESDTVLGFLRSRGPSELSGIREISPLSRRELLVLLEWMEKDGLILNDGERREAVR